MIIILLGYMGSGKSTLGKGLATILKYDFLDLDDFISKKENRSVPELFEKKGEIYFRKIESQYLAEILDVSHNLVLALGGGTPCYGNNMSLLISNPNVRTFYLKLSIPHLAARLFPERENRPLINHLDSEADLQEFIGKHLFERTHYYNQAHFIVQTDHNSKQQVLEAILTQLI